MHVIPAFANVDDLWYTEYMYKCRIGFCIWYTYILSAEMRNLEMANVVRLAYTTECLYSTTNCASVSASSFFNILEDK